MLRECATFGKGESLESLCILKLLRFLRVMGMYRNEIVRKLNISQKNMQYYMGRYLKTPMPEEEAIHTIGRVALLRKMGFSTLRIETLISCESTINDLMPRKAHFSKGETCHSDCDWLEKTWSSLTFADCVRAIHQMGKDARSPWQDVLFLGRLFDGYCVNVMIVAFVVSLGEGFFYGVRMSLFATVLYILVASLIDNYRQKLAKRRGLGSPCR